MMAVLRGCGIISTTTTRCVMKVAVVVYLLSLLTIVTGGGDACREAKPSLKLSGDATIIGIFDGHTGTNCTTPNIRGLQEMATLAWVVSTLNYGQFIPGVKIGLSLFDTCSTSISTQRALFASISEDECEDKYSLGLIINPSTSEKMKPLTDALHIPVTLAFDPTSATYLSDVITIFLLANNWTTIDHVLATSNTILDTFSQTSRIKGICLIDAQILNSDQEEYDDMTGIVVIFGTMQQIVKIVEFVGYETYNTTQFVFVPTGILDNLFLDKLPEDSILVTTNPVILREPDAATSQTVATTSQTDVWASVNRNVFLDVATNVFDIAKRFKTNINSNCHRNYTRQLCENLPNFIDLNITNGRRDYRSIQTLFKSLNIKTDDSNSIFFTINQIKIDSNSTKKLNKIAYYQLLDAKHESKSVFKFSSQINNTFFLTNSANTKRCMLYRKGSTDNDYQCRKCVNLFGNDHVKEIIYSKKNVFSSIYIRNEGWIAALASITTLGVLCCIAIGIFIIVRKCKGDVLEGNPSFSFLLLLAILISYLSIIPFCIELENNTGVSCGIRIFTTCISYALIFSIMLSRSLMLASCDKDGGFMSHVNGYLQTVLCFFMCGVQLALSLQLWMINIHFLTSEQCSFYKGNLFLVILSYDGFLLLILLCTTPFIVQSKRNYREGIFFTAGAILCTIIWILWIVVYIFLQDYRDAVVAVGLTATATAVLISVFIPRTYLMMSAITRDNIANALPAMAYSNTSILDLNYRSSNQAIYATVNTRPETAQNTGLVNPNFYSDMPHGHNQDPVSSGGKIGAGRNGTPENTYERYDTPPSPMKVTRF